MAFQLDHFSPESCNSDHSDQGSSSKSKSSDQVSSSKSKSKSGSMSGSLSSRRQIDSDQRIFIIGNESGLVVSNRHVVFEDPINNQIFDDKDQKTLIDQSPERLEKCCKSDLMEKLMTFLFVTCGLALVFAIGLVLAMCINPRMFVPVGPVHEEFNNNTDYQQLFQV